MTNQDQEAKCKEILLSFSISTTPLRIQVLRTILFKVNQEFSVASIKTIIGKQLTASSTGVTSIIALFKRRGLIKEAMSDFKSDTINRKRGRPETLLTLFAIRLGSQK
jgi:hypothetical protein